MESIYNSRLERIARELGDNKIFSIYACTSENDFHRSRINPYFLYLTMLPMNFIVLNSILVVKTFPDTCQIIIYYKPDNISGQTYPRNFAFETRPLKDFQNIPEMNEEIKNKIDNLRTIKDKWEMKQIKDAIKITDIGYKNMMKLIKHHKGQLNEKELEAAFYQTIISNEARVAYAPIIATGRNAASIHYHINNQNIPKRSYILLDCGAMNKYGYCADITRTVPSSKGIKKLQKNVYRAVETAYKNCLNHLNMCLKKKIPVYLMDLQDVCLKSFMKSVPTFKMKKHKIWNLILDACGIDQNKVKVFYTHFIGHQVGLDVHDSPTQSELVEGMVITIEPGLYFHDYIPDIPKEYLDIGGVRIEHMIEIGKTKAKVIG